MTREQKLDRAVREAMRLIRGDGPISEDRADEAWRILRAALSTPADAPCSTCGDGLFTGSTTLGTLRPCPDCVPAAAPAPAEQEVGICNVESTVGHHCLLSSGHAGQHQDRHGSTWTAPAEQEAGQAPVLTADDVEWVVNDIAELGVKIGAQFFFLYKGSSLVYDGTHDDGRPMRWRPVYKREFGECCHPWEFRSGQFNLSDDSLACWVAQNGDWKVMPAPPPRPDEDGECRGCEIERDGGPPCVRHDADGTEKGS